MLSILAGLDNFQSVQSEKAKEDDTIIIHAIHSKSIMV